MKKPFAHIDGSLTYVNPCYVVEEALILLKNPLTCGKCFSYKSMCPLKNDMEKSFDKV